MAGPVGERLGDAGRPEAERRLAFIEDGATRAQVLDRFLGQYLPALRAARTPQALARGWDAFRYYLTAPVTRRKPWALSWEEADRVIAALASLGGLSTGEGAG